MFSYASPSCSHIRSNTGKVFSVEKAVGGRKAQQTERGVGGREELLGEFPYLQGRTKVGRRRKERHPSGGGRRTKGLIVSSIRKPLSSSPPPTMYFEAERSVPGCTFKPKNGGKERRSFFARDFPASLLCIMDEGSTARVRLAVSSLLQSQVKRLDVTINQDSLLFSYSERI